MPEWLQVIAKANPVTWSADALRYFAFDLDGIFSLGTNMALLVGFAIGLVALGALLARKVLTE
jgi:ABC-type multidrug transport system permease subunit